MTSPTQLCGSALSLAMLATSPAWAEPIALIDLGRTDNTTGTTGGVTYNDLAIDGFIQTNGAIPLIVNGAAATTDPAPLLDTSNATLDWTIALALTNVTARGGWGTNGSSMPAPFPASLSSIAESALEDNLFLNRFSVGQVTLAGLDDTAVYNIRFYANGPSGNANMNFIPVTGSATVPGSSFSSTTIDALNNETEVVAWDRVSPDLGVIAFTVESNREGWMNFMSIEQVSEDEAEPFQLRIARNSTTGLYDFEWDSQDGKIYDLLSSTDLATPISSWAVYDPDGPGGNDPLGSIPSAGAITTLTDVPGDGSKRFFAMFETDAPPLFFEDFETDGGGFTQVGTPNDWAWGTPNSNNDFGLVLTTGNDESSGAWATNLGADGTPPTGVIDSAADSILQSPAIDLTGVTGAQLSFAAAFDAQLGDVIEVLVRNADTDALLETITPVTETLPASADWATFGPFDLSAADNTNVYLEFRYVGTDANYLGLYIDDVTITE